MYSKAIRSVSIVGTGLIGTSVALALRRAAVAVRVSDTDPAALAEAIRLGAGDALRPGDPPADVAIIATPPSAVVDVLRAAQARGLAAAYTDVAGTKARIVADAELAGADFTSYVPGHPIAGRELSGPRAACADLFGGLPWVLCPHPATRPESVSVTMELIALCGAECRLLSPHAHDRVVAATSHAPHVVAAAMAARFAADPTVLSLAGKGLHDATRIATGSPHLWHDILEHNAEFVATELETVARDLDETVNVLRRSASVPGALADLLERGQRGREHIADALLRTPVRRATTAPAHRVRSSPGQ